MEIKSFYYDFLNDKNIKPDDSQIKLLNELSNLHDHIVTYKTIRANKLQKILKRPKINKGIYVYGKVGTGKTTFLDCFYQYVPLIKKKKIHYQNFIKEIQEAINHERVKNSSNKQKDNYIDNIADNLSKNYRLIYIDELEIQDIVDAMLINNLFKALFKKNVMLIISSNRHPKELYKNGLQRNSFEECISLIIKNLIILDINSNHDYRLDNLENHKKYFYYPINKKNIHDFNLVFQNIIDNSQTETKIITFKKREIICPITYKNIALFDFEDILNKPLSSADYEEICQHFKIIFLKNLQTIHNEDTNLARRFINFIDILYNSKTILITLSEVKIEQIYIGDKQKFEFNRTKSRLIEMHSHKYINRNIHENHSS